MYQYRSILKYTYIEDSLVIPIFTQIRKKINETNKSLNTQNHCKIMAYINTTK